MSLRTLIVASLLVCLSNSTQAGTWYVRREAGTGSDGLSWPTAFQRVQDALAIAQPGDQVWVAKGLYRPGAFSSARDVTFRIPPGIAVYGGFAGGETSLSQRNWIANETILSGDLHLDDAVGFVNRTDNCYHVVTLPYVCCAALAVVLDGFSIRGGNANGPGTDSHGGGIYANAINLEEFAHLVIHDNLGGAGGGVFTIDGFPRFTDCELRGNRAATGGGAYCFSDVEFRNTIVQGNVATAGIGGVVVQDGTSQFQQTLVAWNQGTTVGGVVVCCAFNGADFANSILWGNIGSQGSTAADQLVSAAQLNLVATDIQGDPTHLDLDPRWVNALGDDGVAGTGDEDFHLSCTSPLIDRGNNAAIPTGLTLDYEDHPRRIDDPAVPDTGTGSAPIVDLGPYEFSCGCTNVESYCVALPNSTGAPAVIGWSGSTSVFVNSFTLLASGAPALKSGLFFYGSTQTNLPWGDGIRCVGGSLQRLAVLQTDAAGNASFALDFTLPPASSGPHAILPGSSWHFQLLFRDPAGGPAGWNTTDALEASFCP